MKLTALILAVLLCNVSFAQIPCNNWLSLPIINSSVSAGDLDIPGNQITIEATINRTQPYLPGGGDDTEGDVVSKHNDFSDVNYLLRPNHAYITTSNGFFGTPDVCNIELNKVYHVALVYDGSTLKFYRDGFLMSQVPATGNLIQNNWQTRIGWYEPQGFTTQFLGFINEVRIWNVARTQAQIKTYMNASLLSPATQVGLLAYYTFDNLINKQGTSLYNGTINGSASINSTVSNCAFTIDSCPVLSQPQTCNGSLGAPVVNITFGSGASNPGPQLSVLVPGASTNYNFANYVSGTPPSPPVIDGDYALVNQVPSNSAWYTGATDHTGDPNGYMAYFNAAPNPGEFYKQTVSNLCPGTTYEFAAWVANAINPSILPTAIKPNITFNILDANTQAVLATYNTGDIPNSSSFTWKQYSFLFTLPAGKNSVTLVLANNNIGGPAQPGNDLAIDDITFKPCGPLTNASFSNSVILDSTGITNCSTINLFGKITGSFNAPSYQWQVSKDGGNTYTDIAGATAINATYSSVTNNGKYMFRLLSAELGNINSVNCRFISNLVKLTVTGCSQNGLSKIINDYTPVISFDPCTNKLTVEDAAKYNAGDTVLIIQMKGAVIDSSNTAAFGTVTDYKNAGNYEFNYVKSKAGNIVELKNILTRQYDLPDGKVQLIRVPYFQDVVISDTLTCLPWDGKKGGVLVLNAANTITLNADINVSGKGFKGGSGKNSYATVLNCAYNDFSYPTSSIAAADKGESIYAIGEAIAYGKGANAGGGGGGNGHNSGGGGGGNGGTGGFGGYQLEACGNAPFDNRGFGGNSLTYNNAENKIFPGGGGGSGHTDNAGGVNMNGGNGGGMAIIIANTITNNGFKIISNGANAQGCDNSISNCHDGSGGGGAAGTILIKSNSFANNINIEGIGGKGGDLVIFNPGAGAGRIGPGGGGGGASVWLSQNNIPGNIIINKSGGLNGVIPLDGNNPWGATAGMTGQSLLNLQIPVDNIPFKTNIDSVRIKTSSPSCNFFNLNGLAYTNNAAINKWEWFFDDGTTTSKQNTTHSYNTTGSHPVKLIVTDINGCSDSTIKQILISDCINAVSTVINDYTPVIAFDPCTNKLTVEDAGKYNAGDTVLIIQMKGAVIDSSNTAAFGTITNYKNAGNYEFNYVKSKAGNIVELKNILTRQYDLPDGKVQLIRVPYFKSTTITDTLTCLPWDGRKGGVLVLNAKDTVTLNAPIDVSGKGFKGGKAINSQTTDWQSNCGTASYFTAGSLTSKQGKGEGIAEVSGSKSSGRGPLANGGGGGNLVNTGGGGGSNGTAGGNGGDQYEGCSTAPNNVGGIAGKNLLYTSAINKIFMGGGGGSGDANDPNGTSSFDPDGGNGGGIIILNSDYLDAKSFSITANGDSGKYCTNNCREGMGGGGAGGTVLLHTNNLISPVNSIISKGGKGSNNTPQFSVISHGPGGGGSGGVLFMKGSSLPPSIVTDLNGGQNGVSEMAVPVAWGSTPGTAGEVVFNLTLPFDNTPFKINIDSVRIKTSSPSCNFFNLNGLAYTNTAAINKWEWFFDDGTTALTQNTTHAYSAAGIHPVKLIVTDLNGCKDSITININADALPANATYIITQPTCANTFGSLNISNPVGSNFQYSIDGTTYQPSPAFLNLSVKSYNLTVKNTTTNCVSLPINLSINAASPPAAATSNIIQPSCTNPSGTITVTTPLGADLQYSIDGVSYQASTTFSNVVAGSYNLTVKNTTSTCVSVPANVTINPPLTAPATPSGTIAQPVCANESGAITVTAPLGANLQYSLDGITYQAGLNFNNLVPGNYTLTVKNTSTSCISAPLPISIIAGTGTPPSPAASVSKQPDCVTTTGTAIINTPLGNNYQYSIDDNTYQAGTTFTNLAPGNYNVTVKDISKGCISPAVALTVNTIPLPPAVPGTVLLQPTCAITTGTINVTSPTGNNIQFNINGGAFQTGTSFTSLPPASYSLTAKNTSTQCISSATIALVNPIPLPPAAPTIGDVIQPSCTVQKGTINISAPAGANFEYSINGGSSYQAATSFNNLTSGTYQLIVRNIATSCVSGATSTTVNPLPPLPPTPVARVTQQPTCIISGGTIVVSSPAGANYQYSIDGLHYQPSGTFTNLAPNTYQLIVRDESIDCISLPATVAVSANTSLPGMYLIPTAFTPNKDGINECFGIKYWGVVSEFQLIIYNRWGQIVFSTSNPNDCWDGVYKGVAASQGNYVYYIKAKTLCGPVEKRGNVMLVR